MNESITRAMEAVRLASTNARNEWSVQRELLKAFDALCEARRLVEKRDRELIQTRAA